MSFYENNKHLWLNRYKAKAKEWRAANKEHLSEYQRRYLSSPEIRERMRTWQRNYIANNPERRMVNSAKRRALKLGIPFALSWKDIVIPKLCPVLGIPLVAGKGFRENGSPSLDRIDNDLGYVPGNVIVVSWRANALKRDATIKELQMLADFYSRITAKD